MNRTIPKVNRNIMDAVFRLLFSIRENAIDLYAAFHPERPVPTLEELEFTTLSQALGLSRFNDLSFIVRGSEHIFTEAQSTWTPNILPRTMLYYADTTAAWIDSHDLKRNMYYGSPVKLPTPEFFIVYTGHLELKEEYSYSEEFFHGNPSFDLRAKVIRKAGLNTKLGQYFRFGAIIEQETAGARGSPEQYTAAVERAVNRAINEGILVTFLKSHRREIYMAIIEMFSQEALNQETQQVISTLRAENAAKDTALEAKDTALEAKDMELEASHRTIASQGMELEACRSTIEELKKELAEERAKNKK